MNPTLRIDLDKLRHNARAVCALCAPHGISVAAVTKCYRGDERMVRAVLNAPVAQLADARLENMAAYPAATPRLLLRAPAPDDAARTVAGCDISMNSEPATLRALAEAAKAVGRPHGILLMVDAGDLREGLYYSDTAALNAAADFIAGSAWLTFSGVGLNLTCYGSVIPTPDTMARFAEATERLQARAGERFPLVSGGNSSSVPLLKAGGMPPAVNNLRFGEAIICGTEAAYKKPIEGFYTDAITLLASLIEVQTKPSHPEGEAGVNAFGERATYLDRGLRRRGLLALGRQDTDHEDLTCTTPGVEILGASSDHLIVDIEEAGPLHVGQSLEFTMGYNAIFRGFTSAYVAREYL